MLFRHSMSIGQQLMPIYNTTVHKNKLNIALNVVNCCVFMKTPTGHKGRGFNLILGQTTAFVKCGMKSFSNIPPYSEIDR